MFTPLHYQIALTLLPGFGPAKLRPLLASFTPQQLFEFSPVELEKSGEVSNQCIATLQAFNNWKRVEEEINFIEKNNIKTNFITEVGFPFRLKECNDAPLLLYEKGTANLNAPKTLAIVGTRSHTELGKKFTKDLIEALQFSGITIVSGLAYGIDSIAHQQALYHQLPTIAVLAHGLDRIYPWVNRKLAQEILQQKGSLLSECRQGEKTDAYLFPRRNRIVAGLSDATLVIESDEKGGSLITANLAWGYHRAVFAVPGRPADPKSSGCNQLIKNQRAQLITGAHDLLYWMNWTDEHARSISKTEPSLEEKLILNLLTQHNELHGDELLQKTGFTFGQLAVILLNLSLAGLIVSLPGHRYQLG